MFFKWLGADTSPEGRKGKERARFGMQFCGGKSRFFRICGSIEKNLRKVGQGEKRRGGDYARSSMGYWLYQDGFETEKKGGGC